MALAFLLVFASAGCVGVPPKATRKPPVPALDIRPNGSPVAVGRTIRFRVYLVQGAEATRIDPSLVRWSVTREQGAPGTVRDGVFIAPDEINDFDCVVRAVYRSGLYSGSSSDVARVRILSGLNQAPEDTSTAGGEVLEAPSVMGERIFDSSNGYDVRNGPTEPTVFSLGRRRRIVYLVTYHYNDGRGATPGTVEMVGPKGKRYGPWQAKSLPSPKGRPNARWVVSPNVSLPPGNYTIRDSSPQTWSHNSVSGDRGMAIVEAAP